MEPLLADIDTVVPCCSQRALQPLHLLLAPGQLLTVAADELTDRERKKMKSLKTKAKCWYSTPPAVPRALGFERERSKGEQLDFHSIIRIKDSAYSMSIFFSFFWVFCRVRLMSSFILSAFRHLWWRASIFLNSGSALPSLYTFNKNTTGSIITIN